MSAEEGFACRWEQTAGELCCGQRYFTVSMIALEVLGLLLGSPS